MFPLIFPKNIGLIGQQNFFYALDWFALIVQILNNVFYKLHTFATKKIFIQIYKVTETIPHFTKQYCM